MQDTSPLQQVIDARGLRLMGIIWATRGERITGVWDPTTGEEHTFDRSVEFGAQAWKAALDRQLATLGYAAAKAPVFAGQAAMSVRPAHVDQRATYDALTRLYDAGYTYAFDDILDDYGMLSPEVRARDPWAKTGKES